MSTQGDSFNDILSGIDSEDAINESETQVNDTALADSPEDQSQVEDTSLSDEDVLNLQEEEEETPPVIAEKPKNEERDYIPRAALEDERRKRQEAQERARQLEAEIQSLQSGSSKQNQAQVQSSPEVFNLKMELSAEIARIKHSDYDDVVNDFIAEAEKNPVFYDQVIKSRNPAEKLYELAKTQRQLSEVGSIETMREKIREEERQKILAETKAKAEELKKKKAAIPTTLTNTQSTGHQRGLAEDDSFDAILNRRRR